MDNIYSQHALDSMNYIVKPPPPHKKYAIEFCFEHLSEGEFLRQQGYVGFDDFWSLPLEFVDDVNYRRGGWSGVSKLELVDGDKPRVYYVKRQENQFRYSLRSPFGRLTFEEEVSAIRLTHSLNLPSVQISCWGSKKSSGSNKGLLVTRAIDSQTLADIIDSKPDWGALLPALKECGNRIYQMHECMIRHGALYPNHIFMDTDTREVQLIDFEGSRQCGSVRKAIKADLPQLVRRLEKMPKLASDALLAPYKRHHGKLLAELV